VQAIQFLGEISILAPDRNWSGGGHVKTLDRPLRIKELSLSDGIEAMTSDGAPSDCVALALLGYLPHKVDLVVAGINPMANVGHDVTYSGTVTAAMEAIIWGVPAIAFSLDTGENHLGELDYGPASQIAQRIVSTVFDRRLPAGILLNVNIPYLPGDEIKGIRITRQGMRLYRDRLEQRVDPRGRPYFWIGGDAPTGIPEDGTDIGALSDGNVSVTPLQLDLTAYPALHLLRSWDWKEKHPQEYKMMDVSEYSNTSESYLK
jgi:5'-nucleotidase